MESGDFDKNATRENFPIITKPIPSETLMLDCKINVDDMTTPVKVSLYKSEVDRFYYNDHVNINLRILEHAKAMVSKGLVQDDNGNTLAADSELLKQFWASEEVKNLQSDAVLFDYMYTELSLLEQQEGRPEKDKWTIYYDEPDKRVFYKKDFETGDMSVMTDCVLDAGMG